MDLSLVLRATLVMSAALAVAHACGRARASVRHLILGAAFAILALLPAGGPVAASVDVPVSLARVSPAPSGNVGSARRLLLPLWLLGTTISLVPMLVGARQLRRLRRAASPWPAGHRRADALSRDLAFTRRIDVLLSRDVSGPLTCGLLRPAIVLPADAVRWSGDSVRRALVHEFEHVRRGDWLTNSAARALCAIYWFHPLVWVARRRLVLEAERACDDAAIAQGDASAYAALLVHVAQRGAKTSAAPVVAMARRSDLARRVAAILDATQARGRLGRTPLAAAACAASLMAAGVSSVQVTASEGNAGAGRTLTLTVVDPFGRVASGVPLLVENAPFNPSFWNQGATDRNGQYRLHVPAGAYLLTAPIDFFPETTITVGTDDLERTVRMEIRPVTSEFSVCVDCVEFAPQVPSATTDVVPRDRLPSGDELARSAEPEDGWAYYQPRIQRLLNRLDGPKPTGTVTVEGRVATNGTVDALRVVSGEHPLLASAAITSLQQTRWTPAHVRGVPVEAPLQVTIDYTSGRAR